MMLGFYESILRFNLEFSLLLLLVIALRWLLKKTAKVYNSYWLWLLIPLMPLTSLIATSMPDSQQAVIIEHIDTLRSNGSAALFESSLSSAEVNDGAISNTPPKNQIDYRNIGANLGAVLSDQVKNTIGALWLIGVVIFLFRLFKQHYTLRVQLKGATIPLKNFNTSSLDRVSLDTPSYEIIGIELDNFSPAVYGFFNPKIYFPTSLYAELTAEQRMLILEHEKQHIRQGHLWINLLWDVTTCINWFNPLVYFAKNLFRHDQEVLCDSLVLKNYDEPQQKAYGHALLSTVSATHSVSLLCSWKMFDQLEERIMNIKSKHQKTKFTILASAMAGAIALSSVYAIAVAKQADEAKPKQTKTVRVIDLSEDHETYDLGNRISIVKIGANSDKKIAIKTNGKTYRLENGQRFIEENGERRALNEQESKEMDDLLEKSERYRDTDGKDKGSIFDQEHVYAYTFNSDKDSIDATDMIIKILDDIDKEHINADREKIKVISLLNNADDPEERIHNALTKARASDDPALRKTIKSLENAKKKIEKNRQQILKEQQRVLKQVEEIERLSADG